MSEKRKTVRKKKVSRYPSVVFDTGMYSGFKSSNLAASLFTAIGDTETIVHMQ
jgi:hypothetical protein